MKYELGQENQMKHIPLEPPIVVQNVIVSTETGQSRDLLTDITITSRYEFNYPTKSHVYRSYSGITREGMRVSARVKTFKNERWHDLEWTPIIGTDLVRYNIFDSSMKYEGHY